jgi:DNA-binding SARP family transcriptional activator
VRAKVVSRRVDFRILGPLEVWQDCEPVPLTGTTQRALLGILLLHCGDVVAADRLMDDLWGEDQPASGVTALHVRVSQLRKALGPAGDALVTRPPGYALMVAPDAVDLGRFEHLFAEGERALAAGDPAAAFERLQQALALWRGMPLADLAYTPFAQGPIARLEELRLAALERRIEAELALGRHARAIAELGPLTAEHPLRERLWALLMLALYRDGRQAEALGAYGSARARLVEELGIDPGPALQELQRRVLAHDAGLELARPVTPRRIVLALPGDDPESLGAIAARLAAHAGHELMVVALVGDAAALGPANERLRRIAAEARVAAFTSSDRGGDALRLASEQDVALLLVDAPDGEPDAGIAAVLGQSHCDVALVTRRPTGAGAVVVPFGGRDHDWAALELGAWLAQAHGAPLRLAGTEGHAGGRDASRLLASASLAVQRGAGVVSETVLVLPGVDGVLQAAADAAFLVLGLSDTQEIGEVRLELARRARPCVLLVRRGLRPGGLAPSVALTRFTWSAVRG